MRLQAQEDDKYAQLTLAALYYKGKFIDTNNKKGDYYLIKSAENGSSESQGLLAEMYLYGSDSIEPDYEKFVHWATLAADQNDALGLNILVILRLNGYAIEQNKMLAIDLITRSASQNNTDSMVALAEINIYEQDPEKAF